MCQSQDVSYAREGDTLRVTLYQLVLCAANIAFGPERMGHKSLKIIHTSLHLMQACIFSAAQALHPTRKAVRALSTHLLDVQRLGAEFSIATERTCCAGY